MGIDLEKRNRGRTKLSRRRKPKSNNIYKVLLHRLYSFLSRRTNSKFNKIVKQRLCTPKSHAQPVSLGKVVRAATLNPGKTVVVIGTIVNETRMLKLPKV